MRTHHHLLIVMAAAVFGVTAFSARSASAGYRPYPLDEIADEADAIIVGKVIKVQDAGFKYFGATYDVAVVKVSRFLKSKPHIGKPKQFHIGQFPPRRRVDVIGGSTHEIRFRPGQVGIWLLKKFPAGHPARSVYSAGRPNQFLPIKKQEMLVDLLKARQKIAGGKTVNGLTVRAELIAERSVKNPRAHYFRLRTSLKNVSNKPITVCNDNAVDPLHVAWTGPDGKPRKSLHRFWQGADSRGAHSHRKFFFTLQPGDVLFLGDTDHLRIGFGILFMPASKQRNVNIAEPGKHTVLASFKNAETGKNLGLKGVWTGVVSANTVTFTVK